MASDSTPEPGDGNGSSGYRALVLLPSWRRWTYAAGASRLPVAMAPLALVFLGRAATGSFATGSVMASAFTFSEALAAPSGGRLIGRRTDLRRGIILSLAAAAVLMVGLALGELLGLPAIALVGLSALAGGLPAGVQGSLRAMLARLVPEKLRQSAYTSDATLLEVEWAAAPALVALAYLTGSPSAALLIMALMALVALVLVRTLPIAPVAPVAPASETRARTEGASVWRTGAALSAYLASLILGYAEGTVNLALAPLLEHIGSAPGDAGFLLAGLSVASAVGGFGYGWISTRLPLTDAIRGPLLLIALGLLILPIAAAPTLAVAVLAVAAFGLLVAPVNAVRSYQLSQAVPEPQHPEGFSLLYAANGVGFGIAGLASAALLSAVGPRAALACAGVATATIATATAVPAVVKLRRTE